jgi:hypothetical protein
VEKFSGRLSIAANAVLNCFNGSYLVHALVQTSSLKPVQNVQVDDSPRLFQGKRGQPIRLADILSRSAIWASAFH